MEIKRHSITLQYICTFLAISISAHTVSAQCNQHDTTIRCLKTIGAAAQRYNWTSVEQLASDARLGLWQCNDDLQGEIFSSSYDFIRLYAAINEDAIESLLEWVHTGVFESKHSAQVTQLSETMKRFDISGTLSSSLALKQQLASTISNSEFTLSQREKLYDEMSIELDRIHWPSVFLQVAALCLLFPESSHSVDLALSEYLDTGWLPDISQ